MGRVYRLIILLRPVVHTGQRFRVRMNRNTPVIVPVRKRRPVKALQDIPAVKKAGIIALVAVPSMVNAEIHTSLRVMAFYRLIKDAERFLKLLCVMDRITGIHIIPDPVLVDLVGDHPAMYHTVLPA